MDIWLQLPLGEMNIPLDNLGDVSAIVLDYADKGAELALTPDAIRALMTVWRETAPSLKIYLRVSPLHHPQHYSDLIFAVKTGVDGVFLTGCKSGMDVSHLAARLNVAEMECRSAVGALRIVAEVTALVTNRHCHDDYAGRSARLVALAAAAAEDDELGSRGQPVVAWMLRRMLILLAGKSVQLPVIDCASAIDGYRLQTVFASAQGDGFSGKMVSGWSEARELADCRGDEVTEMTRTVSVSA